MGVSKVLACSTLIHKGLGTPETLALVSGQALRKQQGVVAGLLPAALLPLASPPPTGDQMVTYALLVGLELPPGVLAPIRTRPTPVMSRRSMSPALGPQEEEEAEDG